MFNTKKEMKLIDCIFLALFKFDFVSNLIYHLSLLSDLNVNLK